MLTENGNGVIEKIERGTEDEAVSALLTLRQLHNTNGNGNGGAR
jgi:hypothetical protein